MRDILLINVAIVFSFGLFAQKNQTKKTTSQKQNSETIQYSSDPIYGRGLYADSQNVFVGNSDGSLYLIHLPSKKSQLLFKLADFTEMRDVEKSGDYIWGMQSGNDGKLVKLNNEGTSKIIAPKDWEERFLDGMDFNDKTGFIMGDPIEGKFSLYHTLDRGITWHDCPINIEAFEGEAGFAGSGTNVQVLNDSTYVFVTGGLKSRFFKTTNNGVNWSEVTIPYYPGLSIGAFSVCFKDDQIGVIVGGDYQSPDLFNNTSFYTSDGGLTWINSNKPTNGYRSCVYYYDNIYYACGTTGIDYSRDNGKNWIPFSEGNYYTLYSNGTRLIATTKNGSIVLFDLIKN